MKTFDIPEVPKTISVSYWNKKRELTSKTKPSGMTKAIEDFLDAYKKTNWDSLAEIGKYEIDTSGAIGNRGPAIAAEIKALRAMIPALEKEVHTGKIGYLRKMALALNDTGKKASAMFAKGKYPKAASAAVEIAADAIFFAGHINPATLSNYLKDCEREILGKVNIRLQMALEVSKLSKIIPIQVQNLQRLAKIQGQEEKAAAFNKCGDDDLARRLTTALSTREKVGVIGGTYPVAEAARLREELTKYADASHRVKVTANDVDSHIENLAKLFARARRLPDFPDDL